MKKRTALISVYHKEGITEFAQRLSALGFEILASGGTAKHLIAAGVQVKDVASLVGGGAILGHRVVTISREVHAGLLATRTDADIQEMEQLGLPFIDLVCVDLYPLQAEIAKTGSTPESVINLTDIGGPTMLRSGAKGRRIVVCDPIDRQPVIDWLENACPDEGIFIDALAAKAEFVVANYCLLSAAYHGQGKYAGFMGEKVLACAYGENKYQSPAGLYKSVGADDPLGLDKFKVVGGESPSYNNLCDLDRLLQTMTHASASFSANFNGEYPFDTKLPPYLAFAVKHGNACGAGVDYIRRESALIRMLTGDPIALFGGLIMVNFPITNELAEIILHSGTSTRRILDGIIAPAFSSGAIETLARKKGKCRLLVNPDLNVGINLDTTPLFRHVRGGFLMQPNYSFVLDLERPEVKKYGPPLSSGKKIDILLSKSICDTSNSNTITTVKDGELIGNGVGQQSRVRAGKFSVEIAREYGHDTEGATSASDSFFPFVDGPEVLHKAGVTTIVTTSGSIRDKDVIEYCELNNISLIMFPDAIGRGFYNH